MNLYYFRLWLVALFLLLGAVGVAQPGGPPCGTPPCGGPGTNPGNGPPGAPISGIELLMLAGAGYGTRQWYRKKRE